jgi:hypothetical protein
VLGAVFEDEASLRILVREAIGLDVQIDAIVAAIDAIVVDRFAEDLAAGQRAGVVRADVDTRSAALFIVGGIQKLALDALGSQKPLDLDALALRVTRLHFLGLLSDETRGRAAKPRKYPRRPV